MMKLKRAATGFVLFLCAALALTDTHLERDVLILKDDSVNETLQEEGQAVLLKLVPEYAAAATSLKDQGLPVRLAKLDAVENRKTATWLDVRGYPTLIWFSNDKKEVYNGGRTRDAIVTWVKKRVVGVEELHHLEDFSRIKSASEVFLLGFFRQNQNLELEAFQEAAKEIEEWPVYKTFSNELAVGLGMVGTPAFIVGTNFDYHDGQFRAVTSRGHKAFVGGGSLKDSLLKFVKTEQLPPYLPYSSDTNERVFGMERQIFVLGPLMELQPGGEALEAVVAAHKEFKGEFAFASAALRTDPADMLRDFFGLEKDARIQVVGFVPELQKYNLLEPLSAQSLIAFCKGIIEETYPRFYKSAPLPEKAKEGFVDVVVGSTFDKIVLDNQKDVLLMVYTSWSDKSKHLNVIWKKLAEHMRQVKSFSAAKIKADANEHSHLTGTAYPYILFYPANDSKGLKFTGEPSVKELLKFVRKHAAIPIDFGAKPPVTKQIIQDEL